jgi:hypothetical protein
MYEDAVIFVCKVIKEQLAGNRNPSGFPAISFSGCAGRPLFLKSLLIGTQTIEVSPGIDYDVCFSEPAPVDALTRRFGRVNRRKEPDGLPLS